MKDEVTTGLLERRQRTLGSSYRLFYDEPLHVSRAKDVYLWDDAGRRYLDAYNNVASVGHCHPAVVDAMTKQAATLNTHTRYLDETIIDYGEALLSTFPGELDQAMFTCTGSEANDLAYRVAKVVTGGRGVIVTANAYHGTTDAIAQMSPSLGSRVAPGPEVWTVPAPDGFRADPALAGAHLAGHVDNAIADMTQAGVKPAAMFIDTIFASDGIHPGIPGMLVPVGEVLREHGVLLIADEVQAGFGRLGSHMWGFARHGIQPDLVTLGKPMGNGHPIGAVVGRSDLLDLFGRSTRYFNTFGGNAVSAAVGHAVLNVLRDEQLPASAIVVGAHLLDGLRGLMQRHPAVGDVRAAGLYAGVEVVVPDGGTEPEGRLASAVVNTLRARGVLISTSGPHHNVLKIRPPLTFAETHVDCLLEELDSAFIRLSR